MDQGVGVGPGSAARNTNRTSRRESIEIGTFFGQTILLLPAPYSCRPGLDLFGLRTCSKAILIVRDFSGSATIYYCHPFDECYGNTIANTGILVKIPHMLILQRYKNATATNLGENLCLLGLPGLLEDHPSPASYPTSTMQRCGFPRLLSPRNPHIRTRTRVLESDQTSCLGKSFCQGPSVAGCASQLRLLHQMPAVTALTAAQQARSPPAYCSRESRELAELITSWALSKQEGPAESRPSGSHQL